jgi:DNA-binding GntR family transcriptional regulator
MTDDISPITRRSLHEIVADRLRDMITDGRLRPGTIVPELELCGALSVSRTPIREALKTLVLDGLVEHAPTRGFVVREIGPAEAAGMFELLAELEGFAAELACARATPDGLERVRAHHDAMMAAYGRGDMSVYFRENQAIHNGIVGLAGNPPLLEAHRRLTGQLQRLRFESNRERGDWRKSIADHEEILRLLLTRDGARLRVVMRDHVAAILETVRPAIEPAAGANLREAG